MELMRILEIKHIRDGKVIWENYNIPNVFHLQGEEFLLNATFTGGPVANPVIPINYFFGLDNRTETEIVRDQNISGLIAEPITNGYARKAVSSTTGFTVSFNEEFNQFRAVSGILVFQGIGPAPNQNSWGPVQSLFITNGDVGDATALIATAHLGTTIIVKSGDSISARMSLGLRNVATV